MHSERDGFALVAAILAIVCMSAMLAAAAFAARQDYLLNTATGSAHRAFAAAELAAWHAVATVDSAEVLPVGGVIDLPVPGARADTTRARLLRLTEHLLLAHGSAAVGVSGGAALWKGASVLLHAQRDSAGRVTVAPLPARSWFVPP